MTQQFQFTTKKWKGRELDIEIFILKALSLKLRRSEDEPWKTLCSIHKTQDQNRKKKLSYKNAAAMWRHDISPQALSIEPGVKHRFKVLTPWE